MLYFITTFGGFLSCGQMILWHFYNLEMIINSENQFKVYFILWYLVFFHILAQFYLAYFHFRTFSSAFGSFKAL